MSSINERSPYFTDQYSDNALYRDLKKGLKALRNTKSITSNTKTTSIYLPQFDKEPDHIYQQRVSRSYLTNYWKRTIQSDSGKVLANPIKLNQKDESDLPDQYDAWLNDTDLEGKPLSVLAKDQLQLAQMKGVSLAFVDYLADSARPFVKEIDIDDVLSFKTDSRTGRLNFLRWQSSVVIDSEDETIVDSSNVIFEVTPTSWVMYDSDDEDTPVDGGEITRYINGTTRITDEIPVSLFYTNKTGVMLADSPYRDLAEKTIEHFQVSSDLKNMMFYALQPILFANGVPDEFQVSALASYVMVKVPEGLPTAADLKWVQVDAAPIEQAREQIADIESQISAFGIDANGIRPSGNQTATAKAIDSAGSNAALIMFASGLAEHLERIIEIMSSYTLQSVNASVTVTPDFNLSDNNEKSKEARENYKAGLISAKAATDVIKMNKGLPEDYDFEIDQAMIQEDNAALGLQ